MKHVNLSNFPLAGRRTLLFGVLLLMASVVSGQPFSSTYTFTLLTGNVASFPFNGTNPAGGTFGPLVKVGVTTSSSSGNSRATGWPVGVVDVDPVDLGKYFSFTVTVQAGYLLNLSTVNFGVGRSGTGPRQWQWRSSLDAYGAPISTYSSLNASLTQLGGVITSPDANAGYTGNVMDLSGLTYQFLSPGVYEFRVYAYNSEGATGTGGLQGDLTITGTMIPPTATFVETTGGVAVSPLAASSTDHALIGFSAGSTSGQTLSGITFGTTSNTNGVLTSLRLVRSTDNDFSTPGDNTTIGGASFAQNPTDITVTGLSIPVNLAEPPHYFLVADVTGTVTGSTPTVTLSMADEGIAITGTVADFSFSGDEYSFLGSGSPLLVASAVSPAFGNVCINPALPPTGSFTLEGTDLDPGQDVVIGPLPGFDFFDVDLVDYAPTLTLVHSGSLSVSVDVRFQPTLVQSYDGEIPVTGGDADPTGAAVTGAGINTAATVTTGAVSGITTTEATVGGSYGDIGCSDVTAFGVEYSTDPGFIPGTGTQVAGTDLGGGTWESDLSGLTPCTPYYVRAYATNNAGDAYGAEVSFSTGAPDAPVALAASDVAFTSFTANWQTVPGATGYVVDVSTDATFAIETFGPDLFISEYVEGSGNNKYIEIYNPTGGAVNLSDYQLRLYSNGSLTVTTTSTLSGSLASGATVVYRNGSAALSGYAVASAVNFNGDDALELWKISAAARVDLIGSIGQDPGTQWTGGGLSTLDRTLVRINTVTGGVTVNPNISGTGGFPTIASEWTGLAIDDVTGLGSHTCVAPNVVPTFVPGYEAVSVPGGASDELPITGLDEGETYYYRVRSLIDDCESPNSNTISVITCTTDLNLIFVGDGVTSVNWELREQLTNTLIRSGVPTVYPAGTEYSVGTCLHDGDFYLVVTSDLGGIVQGGYQGGYRLETAAGARLIDNSNNFLSGTTSQIANGQGFSLPVGTDRLIYTSCDKVDWRNNEYIVVNANDDVSDEFGVNNANSGYQIWFYDPNSGYSFRRFQSHSTTNGLPLSATRACHFKINNWGGNQLQPNVLYNVKVRSRANGTYAAWGPACRFVLDPTRAECPLTHLMDVPGNQYLSCGATRPIGSNGASLVHARPVNRYLNGASMAANKYKFRFRIEAELVDFTKISNTGQYWVNTLGLAPCKTYLVEVSASFNNGLTYCDTYAAPNPYSPLWGRTCLFSTSGCPEGNGGNQNMVAIGSAGAAGQLSLYPNPNNGEQLFLSIDMVKEGVEKVSVDIHDSFGKRVNTSTIAVNEGFVNTTLDLNGSLAAGLYIVNITAGDVTYTERLVVQP